MPDIRSAAFRTQPFPITVNGVELMFPTLPAARWLEAFGSPAFHVSVAHMMTVDQRDPLLDALSSGRLSVEDVVQKLAHTALAEAAGRPWWEAWKLMSSVVNQDTGGRLLGSLVLAGVDAERITLAAWCSAVWALITRNADTTELMKMEMQLQMPPPGEEADGWDDVEDFNATAARLRSMPGVSVG